MEEMSTEKRLQLIEERHVNLAQHVTQLSGMMDRLEQLMEKTDQRMAKTDKRISRLYDVTLRIGADFAERLRKLEEQDAQEDGA